MTIKVTSEWGNGSFGRSFEASLAEHSNAEFAIYDLFAMTNNDGSITRDNTCIAIPIELMRQYIAKFDSEYPKESVILGEK